ncbi:MAG: N-acetyltransferase [Phaeodactylibacter sp.]|nr:N-acetyltransferase [Phaeodactylibacter sp.]
MTVQIQQLQVKHSRPDGRFHIAFDEHDDAVLNYEERKDNNHSVLDFKHTFVPEPLRHRGIASKIVKTAFEYARDRQMKVAPTCPFVESYLDEHEEYAHLRA